MSDTKKILIGISIFIFVYICALFINVYKDLKNEKEQKHYNYNYEYVSRTNRILDVKLKGHEPFKVGYVINSCNYKGSRYMSSEVEHMIKKEISVSLDNYIEGAVKNAESKYGNDPSVFNKKFFDIFEKFKSEDFVFDEFNLATKRELKALTKGSNIEIDIEIFKIK